MGSPLCVCVRTTVSHAVRIYSYVCSVERGRRFHTYTYKQGARRSKIYESLFRIPHSMWRRSARRRLDPRAPYTSPPCHILLRAESPPRICAPLVISAAAAAAASYITSASQDTYQKDEMCLLAAAALAIPLLGEAEVAQEFRVHLQKKERE